MSEVFILSPPSLKAAITFFILAFLTPVGVLGIAVAFSKTSTSAGILTTILIIALLPFALISWTAFSRRQIEINANEIVVKTAFYTTRVNRHDIGADIRTIQLKNLQAGSISSRTNGIGLPGYQAGWFELKNGRSVFVSITEENILYIPTNKNFDIILSLPNPNEVISRLKKDK
ncbi:MULTISPECIES: PH domain-containing protein [unclassified Undibacterium]|uniref:PH domain-containing protein n=1 Tax=unclassified Undibacterium TaxID=2630295 RepID=UPI002AC8A30C|nr:MULTISPECIES: PH domain-containing protein [unclassified Undibacterium]MEB0141090.1 PH domain-containing protein [Undibacterium sp. CCC2.1]MEB0174105.1 PH domain-containing protein [Undibacterium sp. CCC1.1]MEB0178070.1 PH domain-containing protein [Undibacterium sp. CCC3.4]MEB0217265.1 PH domain-containing protein [Undibacterium sp. 5I2]WPX43768.1 PH domain-containing protein [Undibacterium sp. CCC3.4]